MIHRFNKYLEIIDCRLNNMFQKQAPFLKCKKGCAYCCKEGEYPLSELEYANLMLYYSKLPSEVKGVINSNVRSLIEKNRKKMYECPFLINNICSVYPARPIICRTFGLIYYAKDGRKKMPFCVNIGLNYSDVYDKESATITKCAPDGTEPVAFNIHRRFLRSKEMEETFDIFFGEDKSLIEWLKEEEEF